MIENLTKRTPKRDFDYLYCLFPLLPAIQPSVQKSLMRTTSWSDLCQFSYHGSARTCEFLTSAGEPFAITLATKIVVLALAGANGRFRNCTTVDLTVHFARPVLDAATILETEIVSNGRRMAVLRVTARPEGSPKIAATATAAFAYLED